MYRDRFVTSYATSYFFNSPSPFSLDRNTVLIVQQSIVRGTFWLKGNLCWSQIALAGAGAFFLVCEIYAVSCFWNLPVQNISVAQTRQICWPCRWQAAGFHCLRAKSYLSSELRDHHVKTAMSWLPKVETICPSMERFENSWQHVKSQAVPKSSWELCKNISSLRKFFYNKLLCCFQIFYTGKCRETTKEKFRNTLLHIFTKTRKKAPYLSSVSVLIFLASVCLGRVQLE